MPWYWKLLVAVGSAYVFAMVGLISLVTYYDWKLGRRHRPVETLNHEIAHADRERERAEWDKANVGDRWE